MPANIKQLLLCALLATGWSMPRTFAQDVPTTQPGTTIVNIHMHQAVAEDVFHELAKQGGVRFFTDGNMWDQDSMQSPMDIDLTNRSFWSATLEVCSNCLAS
jgi:hypothetical protein